MAMSRGRRIFWIAADLVLVAACAILAGTLTARGTDRHRELHVLRFADADAFARFRADPALADRQADRAAAVIATEVWTGVDGPGY